MMRSLFSQIGTSLIAAIAGGVVTIILFMGGWFGSAFLDKLRFQITDTVVKQLDFLVVHSDCVMQNVAVNCPEDTVLVSGSCLGHDAGGNDQVAIGPIFDNNDIRGFAVNGMVP
jgi:hypothetical protein